MDRPLQQVLFADVDSERALPDESTSTFTANMTLPVHRWFRYSAGFSAQWVEQVLRERSRNGALRVLDPFAGSATTLIAAESVGVESWGVDSHPFVARLARAKLQWRSSPDAYRRKVRQLLECADGVTPDIEGYPSLIARYSHSTARRTKC